MTHKELLLLQDNIMMCRDTAEFIQTCMEGTNDPQFKSICQKMIQDHNRDAQRLIKHITQTNVQ